jgi:hypothetical protein
MMPEQTWSLNRTWAALLLVSTLVACGGDSAVIDIDRVREQGRVVALDKTIDDRFFVSGKNSQEATPESVIADLLKWQVPEGWQELPAKQFRAINLKVGDVECYVSVLTGGGVAGNLNRWRGQMGLSPLTAAELDKLARIRIFDTEGHLLDASGTYKSMLGGTKNGYRLRAVYAQFPRFAMSVKMVGPDAAVVAQDAEFRAFCTSLDFDREKAGAKAKPPAKEASERDPSAGDGQGPPSGRLASKVPEGWKPGSGSSMRHVTYDVADGVQCYITFLPGTVGGLLANLNRWLGEVAEPHIDQATADKLPRLQVLGKPSHYLNRSGASKGVLVTYTPLDGETMFVKLTGPKDLVMTQRKQFEAFCGSLREN